jgi:succinate-semialdehyde dehydrogenase/glutarate-semialdehyde dehydrogenase
VCQINRRNICKAGYPKKCFFQSLTVHHDQIEQIIAHQTVKATTLTGSERAGSAVAEIAGKYIKKSVLELEATMLL